MLAQGRAGLAQGSVQPLPAILCEHDVFQPKVTPCFVACPVCFEFDMYSFCHQNDDTMTQRAQCCVQIQQVELTPCFVVCPLCIAPEGLTLHNWVDFKLNGCAPAVGWLHAGWVYLTPAASINVYMGICTCVHMYITCVYLYLCKYVCMYSCIYAHMHIIYAYHICI